MTLGEDAYTPSVCTETGMRTRGAGASEIFFCARFCSTFLSKSTEELTDELKDIGNDYAKFGLERFLN